MVTEVATRMRSAKGLMMKIGERRQRRKKEENIIQEHSYIC